MKGVVAALLLSLITLAAPVFAQLPGVPGTAPAKPLVRIETSMGDIVVELEPEKAPISVQNFLEYAESGFYDGTVIHRAVPDFVIQGGGFTPELKPKEAGPPIPNEAGNGLRNRRGTISVARPVEIDSGTSQFFINVSDNRSLDHKDDSVQGYGYAVFGRVVKGMNVVDRISKVKTGKADGMRFVPLTPVVVLSVKVFEPDKGY